MFRVSLYNLAFTNTPTVTVTSEDAAGIYVKANLSYPGRPFLPWRSTSLVTQRLVFDFGSPVTLGVMGAFRANFSTIKFQAGTTSSTTDYTATKSFTRSPNERQQHVHDTAPSGVALVTYRYFAFEIPAQPVDDGVSYFRLGGVWLGSWTSVPGTLDPEPYDIEGYPPESDTEAQLRQWRERLTVGEPYVNLTVRNWQLNLGTAPKDSYGLSDDLRTAREIERLMRSVDLFLFQVELNDPSQAWIMRRIGSTPWAMGLGLARKQLALAESVGP